jgi:hypothetical protein
MQKLGQIMMKWSLESRDWETVLVLYKVYNVGIPVKYVYRLPKKNVYNSVSEAIDSNNIELSSDNPHLQELLLLFQRSRWKRLTEWTDSYGYSYL